MSDFHFVAPAGDGDGLLGTPVADFNKGGNVSDVVNMKGYFEVYFMLQLGARTGSTAAPVITLLSADDVSPSNTEAIAFEYKLLTTNDVNSAWIAVSSSGYTVVSGDDQVIVIRGRVDNAFLNYEYMQLSLTEPADDPQVGALLIMMAKPRHNIATLETVIT